MNEKLIDIGRQVMNNRTEQTQRPKSAKVMRALNPAAGVRLGAEDGLGVQKTNLKPGSASRAHQPRALDPAREVG